MQRDQKCVRIYSFTGLRGNVCLLEYNNKWRINIKTILY